MWPNFGHMHSWTSSAAPQPGRDLAVGVVEQLVEEVLPALVERQLALQLVEHGEPGRQAGLDRELEQDAPGEGVQRADRGVVEGVERGLAQRRRPALGEPLAEAVAQLGGGLLGERDGGDHVDRHALVDEREDAPDERGRLAGAGAGLDEQRRRRCRCGCARGPAWSGGGAGGRRRGASSSRRLSCSVIGADSVVVGSANQRASARVVPLALPLRPRAGRAEAVGLAEPAADVVLVTSAARGSAGKTPASMPSTTRARSSPTALPDVVVERQPTRLNVGLEERVLGAHRGVRPAEQRAGGGGVDGSWKRVAAERRVVGATACSSPSGLPVLWSVTTSVPSGSSSTRSIWPRKRDRPAVGERQLDALVVAEVAARTADRAAVPVLRGRTPATGRARPAARPAR